MQPLISAEEAAKRLGVSVWRVHQLARDNLIPCVRMGRRVRFDRAQLEAFIANGGRALEGGWRREPSAVGAGR